MLTNERRVFTWPPGPPLLSFDNKFANGFALPFMNLKKKHFEIIDQLEEESIGSHDWPMRGEYLPGCQGGQGSVAAIADVGVVVHLRL